MPTLNRFFRFFATVVAVICYTGVAMAAQEGLLTPSEPREVADIAYYDREGTEQKLSSLKGKIVVVHFWATWCPPCIEELPQMQKALVGLGEGVAILPISLDRMKEAVQAFYDANHIILPLMMDDKGKAMRAMEIKGLPSTVIISREGKEIARRAGVVDWSNPAVVEVIKGAK
jgi:thiol-disulfide isomerase/thioredoxin